MKDEIKEILEKPNVYSFNDECYLYFGDYNKLKDYITNLQEKYERMKENAEILSNGYNDLEKRNEKAIEYIKENCIDDEFYVNLTNKEKHIIEALNILKGGE